MRHAITVAQLSDLLTDIRLRETDVLEPNRVGNLRIMRDEHYVGFVDLLWGAPAIDWHSPAPHPYREGAAMNVVTTVFGISCMIVGVMIGFVHRDVPMWKNEQWAQWQKEAFTDAWVQVNDGAWMTNLLDLSLENAVYGDWCANGCPSNICEFIVTDLAEREGRRPVESVGDV